MFLNKNNFGTLIAASVLMALVFSACGAANTADTLAREKDRERIAAAVQARDYSGVVGSYRGEGPGSVVTLNIMTIQQSQAGTSVPQTTLAGEFAFHPKLSVQGSDDDIREVFPFMDGIFDPAGHNLSLTIQRDGLTSLMHCSSHEDGSLNCTWHYGNLKFRLVKDAAVAGGSLQRPVTPQKGVYRGENEIFRFLLVLKSGERPRQDNFNSQRVIQGHFELTEKVPIVPTEKLEPAIYGFNNGVFNPSSGRLVLALGDNDQIAVNCEIANENSLNCSWGNDMVFTLSRSSSTSVSSTQPTSLR